IGEAVVAVPALEARIAGVLARLHAAEERLKRFIQPVQRILQHLCVDVAVCGPGFLDSWQLRRLHGEAHGDAALFPGPFSLFQPSVVEFAATPQDALQRPFLFGRWHQLVLERLADSCHRYRARLCWRTMYSWIAQTSSPFRERACSRASRFIVSATSGDTR